MHLLLRQIVMVRVRTILEPRGRSSWIVADGRSRWRTRWRWRTLLLLLLLLLDCVGFCWCCAGVAHKTVRIYHLFSLLFDCSSSCCLSTSWRQRRRRWWMLKTIRRRCYCCCCCLPKLVGSTAGFPLSTATTKETGRDNDIAEYGCLNAGETATN